MANITYLESGQPGEQVGVCVYCSTPLYAGQPIVLAADRAHMAHVACHRFHQASVSGDTLFEHP